MRRLYSVYVLALCFLVGCSLGTMPPEAEPTTPASTTQPAVSATALRPTSTVRSGATAVLRATPQQPSPSSMTSGQDGYTFGPPDCPVTPSIPLATASPPTDYSAPIWYRNAEGTLWAGPMLGYTGIWYADVGYKVYWWRYGDLQLRLTRLDGQESMQVDVPANMVGYGLRFPTAGCWEVVAHTSAGDSLRFDVYAYSQTYAPYGTCNPSLADHTRAGVPAKLVQLAFCADAIVLGRITSSEPFEGAFHRQILQIEEVWKGRPYAGSELFVLQDQLVPAPANGVLPFQLQVGRRYVLFLDRRPDELWRIIEPSWTVSEVTAGAVHPVQMRATRDPLWQAARLGDMKQQVRHAVETSRSAVPASEDRHVVPSGGEGQ